MPLIKGKSKKAFEHNIKAEMESGKPQDQALAIAYSMQRKHRKKMAEGGEVKREHELDKDVMHEEKEMHEDRPSSIADAILRKKKQHLAKGGEAAEPIEIEEGQVDLSENAHEEPNHEDDLSFEALHKENYSESDALDELEQPHDSNLHGRELSDADLHDMVDVIRRKMKLKKEK